MQVGESSKINCGLQGALGECPYAPFSKNSSSNFRTSRRSRSSFCILHPHISLEVWTLIPGIAVTLVTLQRDIGHRAAVPASHRNVVTGRLGRRIAVRVRGFLCTSRVPPLAAGIR